VTWLRFKARSDSSLCGGNVLPAGLGDGGEVVLIYELIAMEGESTTMEADRHGISFDLVIHPGETVLDILRERALTQRELAVRAGVSEALLRDVICGRRDISKTLAEGLGRVLGVPRSFWLNLQANYDRELLGLQEGAVREDG
jgi:addiction module HigA family antidote